MHFSLMSYCEIRPGERDSFELLCSEAQAAERAGFDAYLAIEHHQTADGQFSCPLLWLTGLAARTTRIRLGTAVALLPLYHSIRMAEEVATLDIISGGRAFLGVGLGYQEKDFVTFSVPIKERVGRFREAIDILRAAGKPHPVDYHGKYNRLDEVWISPKPLQRAIPIWGGGMSEQAIRRVAAVCDGWITGPKMPFSQLAELADIYREAAQANGRTPRIIAFRDAWVADSYDEAREQFGPALLGHYRAIDQHSGSRQVLGAPIDVLPDDPMADHAYIIGNAEQCMAQMERYRERFGVEGFLLRMRMTSGPEFGTVLSAIERFGREVIACYKGGARSVHATS